MTILDLISLLNSNQGALMAILTAIYVGATILILSANSKMVTEMRLNREQLLKPLLVMSFESRRGGLMCLILKNLGGSTATKLRIEFSDDSINRLPKDQDRFKKLKSASLTIVPKQEIIFPCGGPQYWKELLGVNIEGELIYDDIFHKANKDHFSFDIESFGGTLVYGSEMDELTTTIRRGFNDIKEILQHTKENNHLTTNQP